MPAFRFSNFAFALTASAYTASSNVEAVSKGIVDLKVRQRDGGYQPCDGRG